MSRGPLPRPLPPPATAALRSDPLLPFPRECGVIYSAVVPLPADDQPQASRSRKGRGTSTDGCRTLPGVRRRSYDDGRRRAGGCTTADRVRRGARQRARCQCQKERAGVARAQLPAQGLRLRARRGSRSRQRRPRRPTGPGRGRKNGRPDRRPESTRRSTSASAAALRDMRLDTPRRPAAHMCRRPPHAFVSRRAPPAGRRRGARSPRSPRPPGSLWE